MHRGIIGLFTALITYFVLFIKTYHSFVVCTLVLLQFGSIFYETLSNVRHCFRIQVRSATVPHPFVFALLA